jgi:S1-C subfamily serine protease
MCFVSHNKDKEGGTFMQQVNEPDHLPLSTSPGEPAKTMMARPASTSRGLHTTAIVGLIVLIAVVFSTGLFAGWVYGTQIAGNRPLPASPAATAPQITGNALDAARAAVVAKVRPAVVQINVMTNRGSGLGSGVILDSRGYIVTNAHVIANAQRLQVVLSDGSLLTAQLVGIDSLDDLAVVKVTTTTKLTAATLADSSKAQVGQEVLAIGNPLGITQTVTNGIISALDRVVSTIPDAIQTDAAINPGNSGGALVNLQGEVVGIPTLSAIDPLFQTPANGVGFAIPSNRVRFITQQLIENGKVTRTGRAALGIQITTVDAAIAAQDHLSVASGVLIVQLTPKSAAAEAGLQAGDVIVQVGKYPVTDTASLGDALLTMKPGEGVPVRVARGNQQQTFNVTLGEVQIH